MSHSFIITTYFLHSIDTTNSHLTLTNTDGLWESVSEFYTNVAADSSDADCKSFGFWLGSVGGEFMVDAQIGNRGTSDFRTLQLNGIEFTFGWFTHRETVIDFSH